MAKISFVVEVTFKLPPLPPPPKKMDRNNIFVFYGKDLVETLFFHYFRNYFQGP